MSVQEPQTLNSVTVGQNQPLTQPQSLRPWGGELGLELFNHSSLNLYSMILFNTFWLPLKKSIQYLINFKAPSDYYVYMRFCHYNFFSGYQLCIRVFRAWGVCTFSVFVCRRVDGSGPIIPERIWSFQQRFKHSSSALRLPRFFFSSLFQSFRFTLSHASLFLGWAIPPTLKLFNMPHTCIFFF